jgi:hypothetical protein
LLYNTLADLVLVIHVFFILFVLLGGFLVLWKSSLAWCHVPAVFWAACIEFFGWICPLTPLENILRQKGDIAGYDTGFIEHYIIPILYPSALTRQMQIYLGIIVLCINIGIYLAVWRRMLKTGNDREKESAMNR